MNYATLTVNQLKVLLRDRNLKKTGRKTDLVQRLIEDDLHLENNPLENFLEKKTVKELQTILKQNRISPRGKKKELVIKIIQANLLKNQSRLDKYGFIVPKYKEKKQPLKTMKQTTLKR